MKYRAVLFDADGMTLQAQRFSDQFQKDYGVSWDRLHPFFAGPFQQCKLGKADLKEELAKVLTDWSWNGSVETLVTYWFRIGSTPNPEIIQVANDLRTRGIKCFLATNQERHRADFLRTTVGLEMVFDGLLVSAELGYTKDMVEFFAAAYDKINAQEKTPFEKGSVLFVDHEEKNLATAQAFGLATHTYRDAASFRAAVFS